MIVDHVTCDASCGVTDENGCAVKHLASTSLYGTARASDYPNGAAGCPPFWISPGADSARNVLLVDGEHNAMAAWKARPGLAVAGISGLGVSLPPHLLKDKTVFILVSASQLSHELRHVWGLRARNAGAAHVVQLQSMGDGDPCAIARTLGLSELQARLP